ncbi:MAG: hypothetical protein C4326_08530 [Ignavibacteria bacterium]
MEQVQTEEEQAANQKAQQTAVDDFPHGMAIEDNTRPTHEDGEQQNPTAEYGVEEKELFRCKDAKSRCGATPSPKD